MTAPTPERLREVLDYNPETGELVWKKMLSNKGPVGQVAGSPTRDGGPNSSGHIQVGVDNHNRAAHYWIWLMMTGEPPPAGTEIDHIDQDGTNNRWSNLRLLTRTGNMENVTFPNSHNKSGFRGVDFHAATGKWRACIRVQGKQKCLGYFVDPEIASAAYLQAKADLHPAWNPHAVEAALLEANGQL